MSGRSLILGAVFPPMKEKGLQFDIPLPQDGLLKVDFLVKTIVPWQKSHGLLFWVLDVLGRSRKVPLVASSCLTATALSRVCRAWGRGRPWKALSGSTSSPSHPRLVFG